MDEVFWLPSWLQSVVRIGVRNVLRLGREGPRSVTHPPPLRLLSVHAGPGASTVCAGTDGIGLQRPIMLYPRRSHTLWMKQEPIRMDFIELWFMNQRCNETEVSWGLTRCRSWSGDFIKFCHFQRLECYGSCPGREENGLNTSRGFQSVSQCKNGVWHGVLFRVTSTLPWWPARWIPFAFFLFLPFFPSFILLLVTVSVGFINFVSTVILCLCVYWCCWLCSFSSLLWNFVFNSPWHCLTGTLVSPPLFSTSSGSLLTQVINYVGFTVP